MSSPSSYKSLHVLTFQVVWNYLNFSIILFCHIWWIFPFPTWTRLLRLYYHAFWYVTCLTTTLSTYPRRIGQKSVKGPPVALWKQSISKAMKTSILDFSKASTRWRLDVFNFWNSRISVNDLNVIAGHFLEVAFDSVM